MVECPVPPETMVTLIGLNDAVVPLGVADADRVIVPLNPLREVRVMVDDPLVPWRIETDVGEALMLKSPAAGAVTVRLYVALCDVQVQSGLNGNIEYAQIGHEMA